MEKLIVASGNKHKLAELKSLLGDFYNVVSMKDEGYYEDIIEDGSSFYENSLIKAKTVSLALNEDALSDDSGIMVDSLNGDPGIYSARYSASTTLSNPTDTDNNNLLLKNLHGIANREAKFVCSIVLYKTDGTIITGYGETKGYILDKPVGENGFGYDPLFFSYDLNKPLGMASEKEKNTISHRSRAISDLLKKL